MKFFAASPPPAALLFSSPIPYMRSVDPPVGFTMRRCNPLGSFSESVERFLHLCPFFHRKLLYYPNLFSRRPSRRRPHLSVPRKFRESTQFHDVDHLRLVKEALGI